jgi:hypothetical protein
MLALLLMSMPRFRFWNRARPPVRTALRGGPPPAPASPSPAAAGSVTGEARPAPRAG